MIVKYKIDGGINEYIPVHLNVIFSNKHIKYYNNYLSDELVEELYKVVNNEKEPKIYVFDFYGITQIDSRAFQRFTQCINENNILLFINLSDLCYKALADDDLKDYTKSVYEKVLITNNIDNINDIPLNIQKFYKEKGYTDKFTKKIVADYIYYNRDEKEQELESTSLKSNMYIDIKSIFYQYDIYVLVIYKLCNIIKSKIDLGKIDYLVSASHNGAILATILGQALNKISYHLVNLGPCMNVNDIERINEMQEGKKYIFIYDFICMGTEYKLAKLVLELKKCSLDLSVGVSNYLKFNSDSSVESIFYINDNNIRNFNYKTWV